MSATTTTTDTPTQPSDDNQPPRLTLERARRIVQLLDLGGGHRG